MATGTMAEVNEHALAGDVPRLVEALVAVAECDVFWGNQLQELKKVLNPQQLPCRIAAATALSKRIQQVEGDNARTFLEYVVDGLIDSDDRHVDLEEALAVLKIAAGGWFFHPSYRLEDLGKIVLKAGGVLDDDVVAVMRRSAFDDRSLKAFVATVRHPLLNRGEPWADRALDDLSTMDSPWSELVALAVTATDAEPSAKWVKQGRKLLTAVGERRARDVITGWLALLGQPRTLPLSDRQYGIDIEHRPDPYNAVASRGLVWLLGLLPADAALAQLLADLVENNMRKVPGVGPRNPKVAGGAIHALARLDSDDAVAQLSRLAKRVTHKTALKDLHAALDARAAARKLARDDMELVAVPTYGLTEVGLRVELLGEDTANLRIENGHVTLRWHNAAGVALQSAPTAVKNGFGEELKELKAAAKEVAKTLTAQAELLDRGFLSRHGWRWSDWQAQYLDHVLLGTLTRRMLWVAGGRPCGFADGCLRGLDGTPLWLADKDEVGLWHPLGRPDEEVRSWQEWLAHHGIVQPFRQADREVFAVTEAERQTRVYSDRFAGRQLRQQTLNTPGTAKGWRLGLATDGLTTQATRDLPEWRLCAQVQADGAHVGRVAFVYEIKAWRETVALEQVPPLVFSEVMREVDLLTR